MNRKLLPTGVVLGLIALGASGASGPATAVGAGPVATSPPEGAVVVRDAEQLRQLVAQADGPSVLWLPRGTYRGDLRIQRPLTLIGEWGATIEGSGTGTVIELHAEGARLENLVIRRSGQRYTNEDAGLRVQGARNVLRNLRVEDTLFGISLEQCVECQVHSSAVLGDPRRDNVGMRGDAIKVWESHRSIIENNVVESMRDVVVWYSRHVTLSGNTIRNSRYGTHFMYAHDSVVRGSTLRDNVVGIFVMYSARLLAEGNTLAGGRGAAGVGIGFKESDGVAVRGNTIAGNTTGVYLDRTPRSPADPVFFTGNTFALNDVAMRYHSSQAGVHFTGNTFRHNGILVEVEGGGDVLGVQFNGNAWSDYAGFDLDGDGTGDVAFELKKLSREWTDGHPAIRLFQGTAAMMLVDAISNAVPLLASRKMLVDPRPRLRSAAGVTQ